jgi:Icc-related predicted phosphoesterase
MDCWFVSDLHGRTERYEKLFAHILKEAPDAVFFGGDLLPFGGKLGSGEAEPDFLRGWFINRVAAVREKLGRKAPRLFLIMGNDDPRMFENEIRKAAEEGLWEYVHNSTADLGSWTVYGYACVPPTPFRLKDWERYDVSRYLDPGDVSPEQGVRTVEVPANQKRYRTISEDLDILTEGRELSRAIFLFHSPPHDTGLDRVASDGKLIDHVPLPVHVGSVAIRRFIEQRQPLLTLHGHIHESASLTGVWHERIGRTHMLSAAHDGPELCLVRFDPDKLDEAGRTLI